MTRIVYDFGQLSSTPAQTFWDIGSKTDPNYDDFGYKFTVPDYQNFNLAITNVVGDVALDLYRYDINGNINYLGTSDSSNNHDESFNVFSQPETNETNQYLAVVRNHKTTDSTFNFYASATRHDQPSNLLPIESNLGTVDQTHPVSMQVRGGLGDSGTAVVYSFHLNQTSNLNLFLEQGNPAVVGAGDCDVIIGQDINHDRIIRDSNVTKDTDPNSEVLARSQNVGNANETITKTLPAGDYFVEVYQFSGNTDPTLHLSVS